jgi:hypothetical protein
MNSRPVHFLAVRPWLCVAALLVSPLAAWAEGDSPGLRVPLHPTYQQECASCHVAYAPGLLPVESWQRLMNDLPHHFGVDASLDAASTKTLSAWLAANAGASRRARAAPPGDRITKAAWFLREHGEVSAATWKRTSVKSPSNCSACHAQADQGDFDEDRVRIPR